MRMSHKFLCGVPKQHCCGGKVQVGKFIYPGHSSPKECFNCMKRYLVRIEGYERVGSREFSKPGCPIRVLTRPGKFGQRVRVGKNESNQTTRKVCEGKHGNNGGGIFCV